MRKLLQQYSGLKKEIYVLFVGKLVTAMGAFVWPMLTFFLTSRLGYEDEKAALIIAVASTFMFPASIVGGKLADKFSRKKIIILFDTLTFIFYLLAGLIPFGFQTVVFVFTAGLFQTAETASYDALTADFSTTKDREKAFSLSYLGYNLGFIVGASLAGIMFRKHTSLAFIINGLSIFCSTVLIFLFVHPKNAVLEDEVHSKELSEYEKPVEKSLSVFKVLKSRKVLILMLLISCFASMPTTIVGILLPLQLNKTYVESGPAIYGYLNGLNGLVVILMTPVLTLLLKKLTEIPKTFIGMVLFVSGMTVYALSGSVWILFVGMFIYTLGEVVSVIGSNPYMSRRIPASHRGRIGGISSLMYSVFSSVSQFLVSYIIKTTNSNFMLIWMIFIVCGLAASGLYAIAYFPDKKTFPGLYSRESKSE